MNNTQKAIIETTINTVAERGMEGFSIREITKVLGISHTNIYAYYKTKDELILDCFYLVNKEIADLFSAEADQAGDAPSYLPKGSSVDGSDIHEALIYPYWKKYFEFMVQNGNRSLFYYAFRDSAYLPQVYMRNNEKVSTDMLPFMSVFQKLLGGNDITNQVEQDYLFAYLLDGTGAFVKHIIRNHIESQDVDVEKIWRLMYGGIKGLFS